MLAVDFIATFGQAADPSSPDWIAGCSSFIRGGRGKNRFEVGKPVVLLAEKEASKQRWMRLGSPLFDFSHQLRN
jgi:hypothetical protein